jgi:hypothetical protein
MNERLTRTKEEKPGPDHQIDLLRLLRAEILLAVVGEGRGAEGCRRRRREASHRERLSQNASAKRRLRAVLRGVDAGRFP